MAKTIILPLRMQLPDTAGLVKGPNNRLLQDHEVLGLAAMYWADDQRSNAVRIAFAESGYWSGAWAYIGEDSRGLWQLNVEAHPEMGRWDLFDAQVNAYFAHELWSVQGWHPWATAKALGIV